MWTHGQWLLWGTTTGEMYFVLPKIRKGGLTFVCDFTETSPRLGRPFPTMWPLARQSLTLGSHSSSFHREAALTGDVSLFPRISNVVARNLGNSSCQTLLLDTTFSQVRPSKHTRNSVYKGFFKISSTWNPYFFQRIPVLKTLKKPLFILIDPLFFNGNTDLSFKTFCSHQITF